MCVYKKVSYLQSQTLYLHCLTAVVRWAFPSPVSRYTNQTTLVCSIVQHYIIRISQQVAVTVESCSRHSSASLRYSKYQDLIFMDQHCDFIFEMFTNIRSLSKYQMINHCGQNKKICVLGKCKTLLECSGKAVQIEASCVSPHACLELETGSWAQPSEPAGRRATSLV